MKGDFSTWRHDPRDNDQGVLHQQGRVTLDADLTAGELIDLSWRTRAARDVVGEGVAAVPAGDPDGFRIVSAELSGDRVLLGVHPGRIWADGVHLYLPADPADPTAPLERAAPYLEGDAGGGGAVGTIGEGVRDAVVLEVALEELSAFQDPERLLEEALGGPDTTERVTARHGLRLVRLAPGETCASLGLADGPEGKGRLTASLDPPETVGGDCPTVEGGGYTGFEHHLYRVEIARVDGGAPRFKWSRFNGGLVGRGRFEAGPPNRVVITANRSAILNSGLDSFYLEALRYDEGLGHWRVVYGTPATLDSDMDLELADPPVYGSFAFGGDPVFLRLWDGIEEVGDFSGGGGPFALDDGINLHFDPPGPGAAYRPGDHWTFQVRAGEIANPEVLVDDEPPHGLHLRRVPLAEIHWTAAADTSAGGEIRDCRRRFRPLSNQTVCCTLLVGDGVRTFGDFNSLEEAAEHLPAGGGDLCLLPGRHFANLVLENRVNVRVRGCARRTMVLPRQEAPDQPVIRIRDSVGVEVSELDLGSFFGPVVEVEGSSPRACREVRVRDCRMLARRWVLRVDGADDVEVARNRTWLLDMAGGLASFRIRGTDVRVERNRVGVWPVETPPGDGGGSDDDGRPRPTDPCDEPDDVYGTGIRGYVAWVAAVLVAELRLPPEQPYRAWGGIHLGGGCEDVTLLENHVDGGAGHGVTLGGVLPGEDATPDPAEPGPNAPQVTVGQEAFTGYVGNEDGNPMPGIDLSLHSGASVVGTDTSADPDGAFAIKAPPGTYEVTVEPGWEIVQIQALEFEGARHHLVTLARADADVPLERGFLYRIDIVGNEIEGMALSGIGFRRFTDQVPERSLPDLEDPVEVAAAFATLLAPAEILGVANVVRDLAIRDNRIHGNLQAVFDDELRRGVRTVGQGGISLGLVETGLVENNRIVGNGTSAVNPTCGIFVGYAEDLEIRGNHVSGNGPVVAGGFDNDKLEGLRSGVFVRFASAYLLGGEADAQQKPAVRITDNRIDQPAGRAVTVLAFGPVSCSGNHLNSERTGRWSVFDTVAGGVLVLNLGGIHRQRRPAPAKPGQRSRQALADRTQAELLLPGGEVLFNTNQVRLGTRHRSLVTTVVLTMDDLGFDGNQSSVFRPDLLFSNALALAFTVRATDNRFREHTGQCFLSLVTWAFGINGTGRLLAMNTTAHNQTDHCILALTNAPRPPDPAPHGPPVVQDGNLEANADECRQFFEGDVSRRDYLRQALFATLLRQQGTASVDDYGTKARAAAADAAGSVYVVGASQHQAHLWENARLRNRYGEDDPRVVEGQRRASRTGQALEELKLEQELVGVEEASAPENGWVVDGRVADERARGRKGMTVELVREDDTPVGVQGETDGSGYFALVADADQTTRLAEEEQVFLRVKDVQGNVIHRSEEPVTVAADQPVRSTVTVPRSTIPPERRGDAAVVYRKPAPTRRPERRSTPLEDVKGIGPKTADKLREAGIPDLETFMRTPGERLVEIRGFDARVMRERAKERLDEVERREREGGEDADEDGGEDGRREDGEE